MAHPTRPCALLASFVLMATVLTACPDPAATSSGSGGPTAAGGAAPNPGGGGGGGGGSPGPAQDVADWTEIEGDAVTLSGTLTYAGSKKGSLRLDFLGAGSLGGLQHTTTLDAVGPWSVQAPASLGEVYVVAFVDLDSDGPSPTDPAGRTADTVTVGAEDVAGIDIELSDSPDLGDLTPGGPHPGSGDTPPTPQAGEAEPTSQDAAGAGD